MRPPLPPTSISTHNDLKSNLRSVEKRVRPSITSTDFFGVTLTWAGRADGATGTVTFTGELIRPVNTTVIYEVHVDMDWDNLSSAVTLQINVDDRSPASINLLPTDTGLRRYRLREGIVVSPPAAVRVVMASVPADVGFVTVQLIGQSQQITNQTTTFEVT